VECDFVFCSNVSDPSVQVRDNKLILVAGATGYVGGRLVPRLLEAGYRVRCLVRRPTDLRNQLWRPLVECVQGDVLLSETLPAAMQGVTAVYYLVHSMGSGKDFETQDLVAARYCTMAAKGQGVQRIIYLGGLGDPAAQLSAHLRSRHDTGNALREAGVPVTEFRAAVVIGSGSLSFELIRYLSERLPVMICPLWVYTRIQPIAIQNVLDYLVAALEQVKSTGRIIEIGGEDVVTYGALMKTYATVRGLKRCLLPVPVLTPRLSSYWVRLVTPFSVSIARPLIEGLGNEVIVRDNAAREIFPGVRLLNCQTAVEVALASGEAEQLSKSLGSQAGSLTRQAGVSTSSKEGMILERHRRSVDASAEKVYSIIAQLGRESGWPALNWAWQLRGWIDGMLGGVGMRRGKGIGLRVGEMLDFWRVDAMEFGRLLRLRAEMKLPGKGWLQFQVEPQSAERSELIQTALFEPKGLGGVLYWYFLYPVHHLIFSRMIRRIAERAEETG
jgi:uncharacterized protein YbjT (DUF2867 family)